MSSYTLQKFSVEKYGSSALKCRVGRLHTILSNCFTFKSRIYMQKPQNAVGSNISGYPARLSTSYIYSMFKISHRSLFLVYEHAITMSRCANMSPSHKYNMLQPLSNNWNLEKSEARDFAI